MYRTRRFRRVRRRAPRGLGAGGLYLVRSSQPTAITLTSGAVGLQILPKLSDCITSDLTSLFREYKLVKCVVKVNVRNDPGNSAYTGNSLLQIAAANDTEAPGAPTAFQQVTSYNNHKMGTLTADRIFYYSFRPKAVQAIGNSGATAYVGTFSANPWIQCSATGVGIPHNALEMYIGCTNTAYTTIVAAEYILEYHFVVRGIA